MGRAALPCPSCPRRATVYTGTGAAPASVAASVSPRDPTPFGGQEHYTAQEAFTLDGGPTPPTHLQPVGPPTYLPHWGPTLYPGGWEDQSLSQGIAPRGGAGRRGSAGERGQPQLSPALLTKPYHCGPCQGLMPGHTPPATGVIWGQDSLVPSCCPGQGWGLGLGIQ